MAATKAARHTAAWITLGFASACSPSTQANDGITPNIVGQRDWQTDTPPAQASFPPFDTCAGTDSFADAAWPLLQTYCVNCHGGAKLAAVRGLDLRDDGNPEAAPQQLVCDMTLSAIDPDEPEHSDIFNAVDPAMTNIVHDFKFASADELANFRSTVLASLETE